MAKLMQELRKYPLVPLFFAFLVVFSLIDTLQPAKQRSELENRDLQQAPEFNLSRFLNNEWTLEYGEYVKDQFLGRDEWISLHSALEGAQGKLENNGVWYAQDGYQIAKNSTLTDAMQSRLATNTTAVAELAQRFPGMVDVMVVPSPANILSDKLRWNPQQMDENALLDELYATLADAGAQVYDPREAYGLYREMLPLQSSLPLFEEEYLYYRTDHHWTTTGGAWAAYMQFAMGHGFTYMPPDGEMVFVEDFYGTNYAKTKKVGTRADTLVYYDIPNTLTVYEYASGGELVGEAGPVMAYEKLDGYDKYGAFLRGNNGYSVLKGNGKGSILLIKDSYGNCFAPYLTSHYETIGIIDLRAWTEIDSIVQEHGYDEILVLYCFESFATDTNAYRMMTDAQ